MSNDFSKESEYRGEEPSAPRGKAQDISSIIGQLKAQLSYIESLAIPDVEIPEVAAAFDDILRHTANVRALVEMLDQANSAPKWKPWTIGGQVVIREGVYAGQKGKLLRMVATSGGEMAQVMIDNNPDFIVEVGPRWLEGA